MELAHSHFKNNLDKRKLLFDLNMIHHLLRDLSLAFAYLKINNDDVSSLHLSLQRI